MDKNQITGIVLITAIFISYFVWFAPDKEQLKTQNEVITEVAPDQNPTPTSIIDTISKSLTTKNDSVQNETLFKQYGIFANAISEKNETQEIKTNNLTVRFSTKGGNLNYVELNNYLTFDKKPLIIADQDNFNNSIVFETKDGVKININDLRFEIESTNDTSISFFASIGNGKKIIRKYSIHNELFKINHTIQFIGLNDIVNEKSFSFTMNQKLKQLEKSMTECRRASVLNYFTIEEDYDFIRGSSQEKEIEPLENITWLSFKHNFFSTAIINEEGNSFKNVEISSSTDEESDYVKEMGVSIPFPYSEISSGNGYSYSFFFGPNDDKILEQISEGFDKNIDFGWPILREVNKYFIYPLFSFLSEYIPNIGLVILLLVFIIKAILLPLTYSSQVGMAKMKVLKPEVDALVKKYENDKQKSQVETMNLYREFGVNPMSGCIPMLLQMPILFAMFRLFPNLLELRQKSFLWADDLSSYDTLFAWNGLDFFPLNFLEGHISLFTLLMTVSTVAYTHFNNQITTQTQPGMKTMSYLMPFIFFFVLNSYAAGLTYYYFLSNLFSIGQQIGIRNFVDDDKIREKLEANKVKNANKTKSSFQNTLSHAMKKQQEKAKNKK